MGVRRELASISNFFACKAFCAALLGLAFLSASSDIKTKYASTPVTLVAALLCWPLFPARGQSLLPCSAARSVFFDPIHL